MRSVNGVPVLGKTIDINKADNHDLVIGIGEPKARKAIYTSKLGSGHDFPSIIHSTAIISPHALIEDGVIIGPYSTVLSGSTVEKGSCLLSFVNINHDITVGRFSLVGANVAVGNNATLGEGSHIAMGKVIKPNALIDAWSYYE